MAVRHDRFVEINSDVIVIEDARIVQRRVCADAFGYNVVLQDDESVANILKENRESNDMLDEALSKAGTEMEKRHIDPSDKLASLSNECKQAIVAYTLESPNLYFHFNETSREFSLTSFKSVDYEYQGLWLLLYKALISPAAIYDIPFNVYRGCKVPFLVYVGSIIIFRQFVSTTTDRKVAENFGSTDSGTLFIMEVSIALGIHKLSVYPEEEEYLLAPNHGYKVVNVKQNGNVREIYLKSIDKSFNV
eukprot:gene7210-8018_t